MFEHGNEKGDPGVGTKREPGQLEAHTIGKEDTHVTFKVVPSMALSLVPSTSTSMPISNHTENLSDELGNPGSDTEIKCMHASKTKCHCRPCQTRISHGVVKTPLAESDRY